MEGITKPQRAYGIDLLKIVSMFLVIILHIMRHGGVLQGLQPSTGKYLVAWVIELAAFCAVNCFALATGFLMVGHKFKYRKMLPLWFTVFFYSVILILFCVIKYDKPFDIKTLALMFMPVTSSAYWYFTAYFCMFFFIPFLNKLIDALDEKSFKILLITGFCIFSITQIINPRFSDPAKLSAGYSMAWIMYLYLLGGGIKKYDLFSGITAMKAFIGYVSMIILTYLSMRIIYEIKLAKIPKLSLIADNYGSDRFVSYLSPTIIAAAVFLMMFCLKLKIPKLFHKPLKWTAPLVFQVYIIHDNLFIRNNVIKDAFVSYKEKTAIMLAFYVFATAVCIFVACILIDYIRSLLFKLCRVDKGFNKLADFAVNKFNKRKLKKD